MGKISNLLHKSVDFLRDYWVDTALVALPILAMIVQHFMTDEGVERVFGERGAHLVFRASVFVAWLLLVGLFFVVSIVHFRRVPRLTEMENNIATLEQEREASRQAMKTYVLGYLVLLSQQEELHFGAMGREGTERLTIYTYDDGGYFVPFGRFSQNPEFARITRTQYPANQGGIADAWKNGFHFENKYPDPKLAPAKYIAHHVMHGLPETVARSLTMQSRLYFGWRITDSSGFRHLAVVMLESLAENRYNAEELREFFGKHERTLVQMISGISPLLPEATSTRRTGY